MQSMAVLGSLPFFAMAATSVLEVHRLIGRGFQTRVRKPCYSGLLFVHVAAGGSSPGLSVAAGGQLLCPRVVHFNGRSRKPWLASGRPVLDGNLECGREPGWVSPLLTGVVVGRTGSYYLRSRGIADAAFGALLFDPCRQDQPASMD
jgi:hypothetical protein